MIKKLRKLFGMKPVSSLTAGSFEKVCSNYKPSWRVIVKTNGGIDPPKYYLEYRMGAGNVWQQSPGSEFQDPDKAINLCKQLNQTDRNLRYANAATKYEVFYEE